MEGLRIGYQLYGAEFGLFGSVDGWNDGECLPFRLAAKIPATEIVAHRGASQNNLEDIIPILNRNQDDKLFYLGRKLWTLEETLIEYCIIGLYRKSGIFQ